MSVVGPNRCDHGEATAAYALRALPFAELAGAESHLDSCPECRSELDRLRTAVDLFAAWPADVLAPPQSLHARLAERINGADAEAILGTSSEWSEPAWEKVAPGIECKLLATDEDRHRVSMLVRLEPGASYPPHTHVGVEELHLLHGELWIDDRKLVPGDYNYGAPGDGDDLVWSETGCTCVLVTSTRDILR
jgi:quercetin dioxygenase-like cupin family protein